MSNLIEMGKKAREAAGILAIEKTEKKDIALEIIADLLIERSADIIEANRIDIENGRDNNMRESLIDRLALDEKKIEQIADGLREIIDLEDPVGEFVERWKRPNGLIISKMRVPIGVIGMIYEARPNVTVDASGLCLKSGNVVILRGGSDAINSNKALVKIIQEGLVKAELPINAVQLLEDTSRETASEMMRLNDYIEVLIPRGGAGLIKSVVNNATIPVIETGTGNCHIFVEASADFALATKIVVNAKTNRPSVCNAAESLLVDKKIYKEYLPLVISALKEKGVEIRGDEYVREVCSDCIEATEEDWAEEYGDYIMAVKVVDGVDEAIKHINKYGTRHSECIVTKDVDKARKFQYSIDAATVYMNASTRFTDGFEFGFGAEIGISNQKLHARGPLGLKELTTIKYLIDGQGQIK